jgi:SulP family sulfate permease
MAFVPMAALAAILFMVAWGMSEAKHFIGYLRMPNADRAVLLLTFGLTVLVDLTVAIGVGVTLASLLFMARMSETVEVSANGHDVSEEDEEDEDEHQRDAIPEGVEVFRISGPFFFGAVGGLLDAFRAMGQPPRIIIVRMRLVPMIDATGVRAVEEFVNQAARTGTKVIFSGVMPQPLEMLRRVRLGPQDERVQFAFNYPEALRLAACAGVSA